MAAERRWNMENQANKVATTVSQDSAKGKYLGDPAAALKRFEKIYNSAPRACGNKRERMKLFVQATLMFHMKRSAEMWGGSMAALDASALKWSYDWTKDGGTVQWVCDAANAYDTAVRAHSPYEDILSPVFALSVGSGDYGQCFTPWDLCLLSADLAVDHFKRHPQKDPNSLSVHEPCIGAGAVVLALFQNDFKEHGAEKLAGVRLVGFDIDELCVGMASLQILANINLFDLPLGHVQLHVRNALTLEGQVAFVCNRGKTLNELFC